MKPLVPGVALGAAGAVPAGWEAGPAACGHGGAIAAGLQAELGWARLLPTRAPRGGRAGAVVPVIPDESKAGL